MVRKFDIPFEDYLHRCSKWSSTRRYGMPSWLDGASSFKIGLNTTSRYPNLYDSLIAGSQFWKIGNQRAMPRKPRGHRTRPVYWGHREFQTIVERRNKEPGGALGSTYERHVQLHDIELGHQRRRIPRGTKIKVSGTQKCRANAARNDSRKWATLSAPS